MKRNSFREHNNNWMRSSLKKNPQFKKKRQSKFTMNGKQTFILKPVLIWEWQRM